MWSMIKGEFRHIIHNRLLLLSVTVICFIPFLYSIFFLKSVWDPYGSTRNLPVAVVNKDIPVEYQGRKMDVGKQTVDELKITARKLYDIADYALRLSTEEALVQRVGQKETSEESPSDEPFHTRACSHKVLDKQIKKW